MNIEMNDGFNVVYAKSGGRPKNSFFENRKEVTEFFMNNLNDIDLIVINDMTINKNELINNSLLLSRYLKIKKVDEI